MKTRKTLALIVALAMILTLIPAVSAADYDASGATTFVFTDTGITVREGKYSGYKTDGTALTINGSGTYIVSGSCSDGSISVKKETTGVTLVLDGLELTSSSTAPIACGKSSEVTIIVSGKNSLTDSERNNSDSYPDNADAESAVIKCKDGSKVVLCGSGSLNVTSKGKNGIKSGATTDTEGEASLTIRELTLNITTTVNDALNAEATLNVESGNITVSAADDGIHSDYTLNIGKTGTAGPTINILKSYEGIEGADISIFSGDITIHSSDDCINAGNSDLKGYKFTLSISGGNLVMDTTAGDGLDSNGTIDISGGNLSIWTYSATSEQPLDADGTITLTGGTVLAAGGSSGMGMSLSASQSYTVFSSNASGMTGFGGKGGFGGQGGQGQALTAEQAMIPTDGEFTITDSNGKELYSGKALCNAGYVFFSSADLKDGESYNLVTDTKTVASGTAQSGTSNSGRGGAMGGMNGARPDGGFDKGNRFPTDGEITEFPGKGEKPEMPEMPNGEGGFPTLPDKGERPGLPEDFGEIPGDNPSDIPGDIQSEAPDKPAELPYEPILSAIDAAWQTVLDKSGSDGSTLTRAMFVTLLYVIEGEPEVSGSLSFKDAESGSYYENALIWAYENKLVLGYGRGRFGPDDSLTREQLATILYRYASNKGMDISQLSELTGFSDSGKVSGYAVEAMKWAISGGLISCGDKLEPKLAAGYQTACDALKRLLENTDTI